MTKNLYFIEFHKKSGKSFVVSYLAWNSGDVHSFCKRVLNGVYSSKYKDVVSYEVLGQHLSLFDPMVEMGSVIYE